MATELVQATEPMDHRNIYTPYIYSNSVVLFLTMLFFQCFFKCLYWTFIVSIIHHTHICTPDSPLNSSILSWPVKNRHKNLIADSSQIHQSLAVVSCIFASVARHSQTVYPLWNSLEKHCVQTVHGSGSKFVAVINIEADSRMLYRSTWLYTCNTNFRNAPKCMSIGTPFLTRTIADHLPGWTMKW